MKTCSIVWRVLLVAIALSVLRANEEICKLTAWGILKSTTNI